MLGALVMRPDIRHPLAMGSVRSRSITLEPDILEKFAARAKRLGTTQDNEISRALREWLATQEPMPPDEPIRAPEAASWHLIEEHGFLVLEGELAADAIPDHRDLREQQIGELVRRSFGEGGD